MKQNDNRIQVHCPTCHVVEAVISGWEGTDWADGPMEPVPMTDDGRVERAWGPAPGAVRRWRYTYLSMDDFMRPQKVQKAVLTAIEASIYEAPSDWGLTPDEAVEAGRAAGFQDGELRDAIRDVLQAGQVEQSTGSRLRFAPQVVHLLELLDFLVERKPERRDVQAFQFIYDFFEKRAQELGREKALATRAALVAQGAAAGLTGKNVEVAVEVLLLGGVLVQQDKSVLRFTGSYASPKVQRQHHRTARRAREELPGVHAAVRDILARRHDGRPSAAETLVAFSDVVARLGHQRFVTWWVHLREELSLADVLLQPTTTIVSCAALAEGALALVAARAREKGLWTSLPDGPKNWKLEALLRAAQSGVPPILKDTEGVRCRMLNQSRQRIHAGRLLEDPTLTVDWKPEEAREARSTLDMLLRRIIDWPPLPNLFLK